MRQGRTRAVSAPSVRAATVPARTGWSARIAPWTTTCWPTWSAACTASRRYDPVLIRPVVALRDETGKVRDSGCRPRSRAGFRLLPRQAWRRDQSVQDRRRLLSCPSTSPLWSCSRTMATLPHRPDRVAVTSRKYGVIELQTTDTHGSYLQAVDALTMPWTCTAERFSAQLWPRTPSGRAGRSKARTSRTSSSGPSTRSSSSSRSPSAKPRSVVRCAASAGMGLLAAFPRRARAPPASRRHLALARRPDLSTERLDLCL